MISCGRVLIAFSVLTCLLATVMRAGSSTPPIPHTAGDPVHGSVRHDGGNEPDSTRTITPSPAWDANNPLHVHVDNSSPWWDSNIVGALGGAIVGALLVAVTGWAGDRLA